jgi:hypothetical protein
MNTTILSITFMNLYMIIDLFSDYVYIYANKNIICLHIIKPETTFNHKA